MLELVNLTKTYKQHYAVNKLNMYIEKGEVVGLLGPNGAGKSTTIEMLCSLRSPTSGDVLYKRSSILKNPSHMRKVTGIVPQEIALYEDLTVEENLKFFGQLYRLKGKDLQYQIDNILELIGLKKRKKDIVKYFSGGMKRRLNIGVALLHEPQLLIMDEPTVGIDTQSRSYILETVKQLNETKNMTIVYTSHYMEEVEFLCDRIYIMDEGHLIASGTKEELKQLLSTEKTVIIQTSENSDIFIELLQQIPSIKQLDVEDEIITTIVPNNINIFQTVLKNAEKSNVELIAIEVQKPNLEDVFLHLTGKALRD